MSKEILRKEIINLRKENFKNKKLKFTEFKKILQTLELQKIKNIGGYYPINSEISCLELLLKLQKNNFKISLPVTKKNSDMDFYEWSSKEPLKVGKNGIPEPESKKKIYPDILIVPLVGFDKNKFRLGYGGGFYDRYIEKICRFKKIATIGLAFSFQKIKQTIPINKYDKKLDFILTDKGIIK